jgi:hypothetical protein
MQSASGTEAVCLSTDVVQDGSAEMLQKNLKECELIGVAFLLVAEQGPKVLKRYLGIMGE